MGKGIIRIGGGIALALFAGSLSLMTEIPTYESLEPLGTSLISQTLSFYGNGQDETRLAAELLGGQLYFSEEGEKEAEQELILAENREESGEVAVSAEGDGRRCVQGAGEKRNGTDIGICQCCPKK